MPKWIHDRAEHLLAKNPSMDKSVAFAIATQQGHKLGKNPKKYGTKEGKRIAKAKYDKPKKEYVKGANPGDLSSPQMEKKKEAAPKKKSKVEAPEAETSTSTIAGTAAAGVAPFAGLIGQKKIIHDPLLGAKGKSFRTMQELSDVARTGDVILTTRPGQNIFKTPSTAMSGSDWYHAQPVMGRRQGQGLTGQTASFHEGSEKALRRQAVPIGQSMRQEGYKNVMLLRPKKEMTPGQMKKFERRSMERTAKEYSAGQAVKNWARDVFMPKIKGLTESGPQVICEGNICSTVPAQAMHEATGRGVVPGKRAQDVLPADYLRSSKYELVGSRIPERKLLQQRAVLQKAMPYLSRSALGLGMAGTVYGASKDPDVVGASVGATAGTFAASALAKKYWGAQAPQQMPSARNILETMMVDTGIPSGTAAKRWLTRRVPIILGGGVAGYYGMKAAREKLKEKWEEHKKGGDEMKEAVAHIYALASCTDEIGKIAKYLHNIGDQVGVSKLRKMKHDAPDPKFQVKKAFAVSQYSGVIGPAMPGHRRDYQPGFRTAMKKVSGPPAEKEKKKNAAVSPASMLSQSRKVGTTPGSLAKGSSIAAQVKPKGFGIPKPAAVNTGKL